MESIKINGVNAKMIAHAGLAGVETVNTAEAFRYAASHSYYGIETDVQKTKDGKFVCFHDPSLERLAGVDLKVQELTLDELSKIVLFDNLRTKTKERGLKIPTLEEYVTICKEHGKICFIELKKPMPLDDVAGVVKVVSELSYIENSVFISFYYDNLAFVREVLPCARVGYTFSELTEENYEKVVRDRFDVNMSFKIIDPEWVARLHDAGLSVTCYTVDDEETLRRVDSYGADYVMTNILE